ALGSRGVLVPAGVRRVPAAAGGAARHAARRRLRGRAPRVVVRRRLAASRGDARMSTVATALVARATRVEGNPDLLQWFTPDDGVFFEHPSRALVTVGAAHTISVPGGPELVARAARAARDALARVRSDDGPAPIVVGALPFDEETPATLVIPRVAFARAD